MSWDEAVVETEQKEKQMRGKLVGKGRKALFSLVLVALLTVLMGTQAYAARRNIFHDTNSDIGDNSDGIAINASSGTVTITNGTVTISDSGEAGAVIADNTNKITIGGGEGEAISITGDSNNGAGLEVGIFGNDGIEIKDGAILTGGGNAAGLVISTNTSGNTTGVVISGGTITPDSGDNAISLEADGATVTILGGSLEDKTIYSKTSLGATTTVRLGANIGASSITGNDNKKINLVLLDDAAATTGNILLGTGSITGEYNLSAGSISATSIGTSGTRVGDLTTITANDGISSITVIYAGAITSAGTILGGSVIDATGDISVVGASDAETIVLTAATGSIKTTGDIINTGANGCGMIHAATSLEAVNIGTSEKAFGDIEVTDVLITTGAVYGHDISAANIMVNCNTGDTTVVLSGHDITTGNIYNSADTDSGGKIVATGTLEAGNIGNYETALGDIEVTGDLTATGAVYAASIDSSGTVDVEGAVSVAGGTSAATVVLKASSIDVEGDIINDGFGGCGKIETTSGNLEAANIGDSDAAFGDIAVGGTLTATGYVYGAAISVNGGSGGADVVVLSANSITATGNITNTGTSGYGKILATGTLTAGNIGASDAAFGDIEADKIVATGRIYGAAISVSGATSAHENALQAESITTSGNITNTGTTLLGKIKTTGGSLVAANIGSSGKAFGDIVVFGDINATGDIYGAAIYASKVISGGVIGANSISVVGETSADIDVLKAESITTSGNITNNGGTDGCGKINITNGKSCSSEYRYVSESVW